jgi:ABC-type cobalamin/Fe3+-siderophores transport system ATPase subunit
MKRSTLIVFVILGLILLIALGALSWVVGTRNRLVGLDEEVKTQWAQVENQFQRRLDLIPNYVETVKGFAKQERDVFIGVTEARAKVGGAVTIPDKIQANNQLTGALSRLLLVVELQQGHPHVSGQHDRGPVRLRAGGPVRGARGGGHRSTGRLRDARRMTPAPVEAKELAAVYGPHKVFAGVSFDLEAGQLAALVGSNGSGKTTLLHTLCGIHRQMTGEVLIAGRSLAAFSPRELARRVALVPQMTDVAFEVTVDETVALGRYPWMGPIAPPTQEDREAVEAALDAMDLASLRDRPLQTLSGGERQRVTLARALAQGTEILFLDEPVASLDLKYQQETYPCVTDGSGGTGLRPRSSQKR